jgi:hypothetical protein
MPPHRLADDDSKKADRLPVCLRREGPASLPHMLSMASAVLVVLAVATPAIRNPDLERRRKALPDLMPGFP